MTDLFTAQAIVFVLSVSSGLLDSPMQFNHIYLSSPVNKSSNLIYTLNAVFNSTFLAIIHTYGK